MSSHLSLNDFEKGIIEEVAVLTDQSPLAIREILELLFLRQIDSYISGEDITVPFLGKLKVKYKGDFLSGGERVADLDIFFSPSDLTRRLVGDIEDGDSSTIKDLMEKKISLELRNILEERGKK